MPFKVMDVKGLIEGKKDKDFDFEYKKKNKSIN
jgi:hypothetical protein